MNLIKFCVLFYVCAPVSFLGCLCNVQMSPTKHSATKKSSKRARTNSDNFKSMEADLKYNDCYKRAMIIMEGS